MKTMTEESLQRKLARLESALDTERARLRKACDKIPWGAGMRRTKCTPSFRSETATFPSAYSQCPRRAII